jgi:hypothetical protein
MNTQVIRLVLFATLLFLSAISGYATVIDKVPFTITASGTYVLESDLTLARGSDAIVVEASNVVIDLKGFTLSAVDNNVTDSVAIGVRDRAQNVFIKNGQIMGFITGVLLQSPREVVENLRILACFRGITLDLGSGNCIVQNCFIDGQGTPFPDGAGILIGAVRNVVQHCQILNCFYGLQFFARPTSGAGNNYIANSIFNCQYGLKMGASDKYQDNVTNGCESPYSDGTAVGYNNG